MTSPVCLHQFRFRAQNNFKPLMFVTLRYNVEPSGCTAQDTHSYISRMRVRIPRGQRILFGAGTAVALRWPTYPPLALYRL
jgi:hypothetical protein